MFNRRSSAAGAGSHPALAGGGGLGLGLGSGDPCWREASEGPRSPEAEPPRVPAAPFCVASLK